jgi:hypothetical protein
MTEQQSGESFDVVRILINVLGLLISGGVVALVIAMIIVEA